MREHPILFNAPMVRAILDGRKSQTRRFVKPAPFADRAYSSGYYIARPGDRQERKVSTDGPAACLAEVCPFGDIGDRLWVRETWGIHDQGFDTPEESHVIVYRADTVGPVPARWRPSIHMPREACRLVLEITDVRVERVQSISDADAIAEGIERRQDYPGLWKRGPLSTDQNLVDWTAFPKLAFRSLWEGAYGAERWAANPWVWAISFRRSEASGA